MKKLKNEIIFFVVVVLIFLCFAAINKKVKSFESSIKELEQKTETTVGKEIYFVEEKEEKERIEKINLGTFTLTAYCSCEKCCGRWAIDRPKDENGKDIVYGASGQRLVQGVSIAVDPKVIPYGTEVYIGGEKYIAQDCGGSIKGNRIDVYFEDHSEAKEFGMQHASVEVFYE